MAATFWEKVNRGLKIGLSASDIVDAIGEDRPETVAKITELRASGADDKDIIGQLEPLVSQTRGVDAKLRDEFQMMPTGKKMAIGIGKGLTDIGQGVSQLVGGASAADVDKKKAQDAVIAEHPVGKTGAIVGETLPWLALPVGAVGSMTARGLELLKATRAARAARTVVGDSALVGAAAGATQPVGSGQDNARVVNTALGGGIGAAVPAAVGAVKIGSDLFEQITRTPEEATAALLAQHATDPVAARAALANVQELVPGSVPSTATATADPNLLLLERSLRQRNAGAWNADDMARNAARLQQLRNVTGMDDLASLETKQQAVGRSMYEPLMNAQVTVNKDLTDLLANPVVKDAWKKAQELADIDGVQLKTAADQVSGRGLHYLKLALDDASTAAEKAAQRGEGGAGQAKARAIGNVRSKYNDWLNANVPEYRAAREAYADASKPVAKAKAGQEIVSSAELKQGDLKGNPVLTTYDFNSKLSRNLTNKYGDVFTKQEADALSAIGQDIERSNLPNTMRGTTGSDTIQNNLAQQALSTKLKRTPIVGELLSARAEGKDAAVLDMLDEAMRDPKKAKQLLDIVKPGDRPKIARLLEKGRHALTRGAVVLGARQLQ